jgi:hypothetical protein
VAPQDMRARTAIVSFSKPWLWRAPRPFCKREWMPSYRGDPHRRTTLILRKASSKRWCNTRDLTLTYIESFRDSGSTVSPGFKVDLHSEQPFHAFRRFILALAAFLSFVTRTRIGPVRLAHSHGRGYVTELGSFAFERESTNPKQLVEHERSVERWERFFEPREGTPPGVETWMREAERFFPVYALYSSALRDSTIEENFLAMAQCAEAFCNRANPRPKTYGQKARWLYKNCPSIVKAYVGDQESFVTAVEKARNYYSHYDANLPAYYIPAPDLVERYSKLRIVMECNLLSWLGVSLDEVAATIRKPWSYGSQMLDPTRS